MFLPLWYKEKKLLNLNNYTNNHVAQWMEADELCNPQSQSTIF